MFIRKSFALRLTSETTVLLCTWNFTKTNLFYVFLFSFWQAFMTAIVNNLSRKIDLFLLDHVLDRKTLKFILEHDYSFS